MSEKEFREYLRNLLESPRYDEDGEEEDSIIESVSSFKERGVLTMNEGLVINLEDGTEVYLTIQTR